MNYPLKSREQALILEGQNNRQNSPEKRLDMFFEVLKLSEELYLAARKDVVNHDS